MKQKICVILAVIMAFTCIVPAFAGSTSNTVIINPYKNVNWDKVSSYKTALHTHTNASDGDCTLKESIERHIETGFEIVATTDHGTVNYSWADENANALIHGGLSLAGRSEGSLEYLGQSGTFSNGTAYTIEKADNGDDYLRLSCCNDILRVPFGIENNALSANAHVNSWFVDYHDNTLTTYIDAVKNVNKYGGVCVINHPGEYSKARYELYTKDAYDTSVFTYKYLVNKYASLINDYDACIGIDINSKGDQRTRFDRKLWDILLERFTSNEKNVFAICSSDAHQLDKINTGYIYSLLESKDSVSLKKSLLNGEFIGASHCIGNPDELRDIAAALKQFYGETEIYNAVNSKYEEMCTIVEEIENGKRDADDDIGTVYSVLDENGYYQGKTEPMIKSITVTGDTISIDTSDALIVRWISNGEQIAVSKAGNATFTVSENDKATNYVRAEVFGEGGILYTQAFVLKTGKEQPKDIIDGVYIDFGFIDCLFAIFKNWSDILGRMF